MGQDTQKYKENFRRILIKAQIHKTPEDSLIQFKIGRFQTNVFTGKHTHYVKLDKTRWPYNAYKRLNKKVNSHKS